MSHGGLYPDGHGGYVHGDGSRPLTPTPYPSPEAAESAYQALLAASLVEQPVTPPARPSQRVVAAALLMDDGHIVVGIRHFSPEMRETLRRLYPQFPMAREDGPDTIKPHHLPYHLRVKEEGFVDQWGTFLTREQAWVIAEREGQIREQVSGPGTLYSENLY